MTGREFIVYILENHLEDVDISKFFKENPDKAGLISVEKAAVDLDVGKATVSWWCKNNYLDTITLDGHLFIFKNKKYENVKSLEEI